MQALAIRLKEKGLKATPQRIAIYKYLEDSKDHPSAETIYRTLRESHPTMSLATVYKTLDSLKKAGLLQQLNAVSYTHLFWDSRPSIYARSPKPTAGSPELKNSSSSANS